MNIADSTAAIIFLGTPHRGNTDMAALGDIARRIANLVLMDNNSAMLDALGLKTSDLERCQDSFSRIWATYDFRVKTGMPLTGVKVGLMNEILYVVHRQFESLIRVTSLISPFRRTTSSAGTNLAEIMEQRTKDFEMPRDSLNIPQTSKSSLFPQGSCSCAKGYEVRRMVLILNMLKLENELVACRSANKTVQRLNPSVVDNAGLVI
jgi:hypothetical protein